MPIIRIEDGEEVNLDLQNTEGNNQQVKGNMCYGYKNHII